MLSLSRESKPTSFSKFIRTASSTEKKRVHKRVLEKATERQKRVMARVCATN
jgi:hypothetical protein